MNYKHDDVLAWEDGQSGQRDSPLIHNKCPFYEERILWDEDAKVCNLIVAFKFS
jgi:hypothetical protein